MAKKYLVKVYNKTGTYLNTWDEVVSNISFINEINTAGGQMTLTLARKAGDYGEGSDVDFGFKVVVYVFDKEIPDGKILFQGYISSYTPIYKDDSVLITVLSFGAELNDYIIEGGEVADLALTKETTMTLFGGTVSPLTFNVAQTFTATATITINTLEVYLKTMPQYIQSTGQFQERKNITVTASIYTGTTLGSGTLLGTLSTVVLDGTERKYKMTTTNTINLTNTSTYYIVWDSSVLGSGSDNYSMAIGDATAYSGGIGYRYVL